MTPIRVGCAGWAIPAAERGRFPEEGSHLERYAARFPAVEVNSSFYRPHRRATWVRWGETVPEDFRFAVKVPKAITHEARLVEVEPLLDTFLEEVGGLGEKLGCLLVQLPPSLAYHAATADRFFRALADRCDTDVACEPRHRTWFDVDLAALRVARVAADPPAGTKETEPGGWDGLRYFRLHGSPKIYWSNYEAPQLDALAVRLAEEQAAGRRVWCIFDNTAAGHAPANGIDLLGRLDGIGGRSAEDDPDRSVTRPGR